MKKTDLDLLSNDGFFMGEALKEAKKAVKMGEWPIGTVIVLNGKIIPKRI